MKTTEYVDFPDMGATVKMSWDANRDLYEIVCGATYIGTAATLDEAKAAARDWLNALMQV